MVDPCEDNCRMKHKLNKNPAGLDYLPNFLASTLAATNDAADAAISRMASSASSSDLSNASSFNKSTVAAGSVAQGGTVTTAESSLSARTQSASSVSERYPFLLCYVTHAQL